MKKPLREHAALFLRKAADDEILLNAVIENDDVSDDIFGFHAQQAIEKLLKAVLTVHEVRTGKTHDLRRLMDECAQVGCPLPDSLIKIEALTPYAVLLRYEELPFNRPFSRRELQSLVRELRKWAEAKAKL